MKYVRLTTNKGDYFELSDCSDDAHRDGAFVITIRPTQTATSTRGTATSTAAICAAHTLTNGDGEGQLSLLTMTTIEKTILKVLTNKWQTLPQIQEQVAEKMGESPNSLDTLVPLFCGRLTGEEKIETKPVPVEGGGYYYVCRHVQEPMEVPY